MTEPRIIEGPYLQDILRQPQALARSLEGFDVSAALRGFAQGVAAGAYKRIVLTGMGSSLYALYPLHLSLTARGWPSLLIETSELVHYLEGILDRDSLVIAVSQSGQSAEVVRLMEMAKGRSPVIGVTNNEDAPLARESAARLLIRAGAESSVSCKTYLNSLLALEWLGAVLVGSDMAQARSLLSLGSPAVEAYLADWKQHVSGLCELLADVKQVFVTGRGSSIAAALTGGLILKESTRSPAEGMSCASFRHGPFEMLGPHVFVLVLAGDARSRLLNQRLAADIELAGGKSAVVDADARSKVFRIPPLPDPIRPIVEILPVQMISLALAARGGMEAGRFERASKITAVE